MFQGDIKRIHTFKMSIIGTCVIVPTGWTPVEVKMDGDVDPFIKLDAYFTQLVNELIGSTSPPRVDVGEGMRSPAAWNLLAQREEEGQDAKVSRFLEHFCQMVQTMQRRACDEDTVEEDAKDFQREMLEIMSREELNILANQPVAETVKNLTPLERQLLVSIAQEKRGNPLYNQRMLELEDMTSRVSADFAERVLLPDADPTESAEQNRMQNLEMVLLSHGQAVPVSPRDGHLLHMQVLLPSIEQMAQQMQSGEFGTEVLEAGLAHLNEHYNYAVQQGVKKDHPLMVEVSGIVKKIGAALVQLKQLDAQAAQLSQADAAHAKGEPVGDLGAPGGPPPAPAAAGL